MVSLNKADIKLTWPTQRSGRLARTPSTVTIIQEVFHHEMAVIDYYVETAVAARYKEGTPIHLQFGRLPNSYEDYYGTVYSIRPHVENERHLMRVVCIGPSYKSKQTDPDIAYNMSVEAYLSLAARRYQFDLVRPSASTVWPMLVRTSKQSEWEHLCSLAKRMGYTLFPAKTTLYCYDPVKMLQLDAAAWPVLTYRYAHGNQFDGDIVRFTPYLGDQGVSVDHKRRTTAIQSVNPRNLKTLVATNDGSAAQHLASIFEAPRFTQYMDGQPAHTQAEADARVAGRYANSRWIMKARCYLHGNAKIRAGMGVHILGVSKESDGLWYVEKAEHEFTWEGHPNYPQYYLKLTLLRDSREADFHPSATPRERSILKAAGVQGTSRTQQAVFTSGFWVSSNPKQTVLS